MTTFEERTREAIRKMTEDALMVVQRAIRKMTEDALVVVQREGADQQAQIEGYTKPFLASLSLDLPLSVKDVLDKGGAVRSFLLPYDVSSGDVMRQFRVERLCPAFYTSYGIVDNRVFDFSETLPAPRFRVTLIIEPLNEEKR